MSTQTPQPAVDPGQLAYCAPNIARGEDWGSRTMATWVSGARCGEGYTVEHVSFGDRARDLGGKTHCGAVRVDGVVYDIHLDRHRGRNSIRTQWRVEPDPATGENVHRSQGPAEQWVSGPCVYAVRREATNA